MSESPIFAALHQGPSNRFACAALHAVAHAPGRCYNPLWLTGPTGTGKTALLQATAAALLEHPSRPLILRVHAEQLVRDLIRAIERRTTDDFRARILGFQVILVDHVDHLSDKPQTQLELGRLMEMAAAQGSQVILASACSPAGLMSLHRTLTAHCPDLLCCDILAPELEERLAIVRHVARARELPLSDRMACRIAAATCSPAQIRCIIEHLAARRKLLQLEQTALAEALDHLLAREVSA